MLLAYDAQFSFKGGSRGSDFPIVSSDTSITHVTFSYRSNVPDLGIFVWTKSEGAEAVNVFTT